MSNEKHPAIAALPEGATHEQQLAAYRQVILIEGQHRFAPYSGICYSCHRDLVGPCVRGQDVSTGCPHCHSSFVD